MTYTAKVFRILIASPSDVQEERDQIVKVIQEWNDSDSFDRKIVLLPLRWETHSSPELNIRPQELINRDVVDHCDMAIGVFWTKLGSPTGISDSGTLEEIERVGSVGKPVMVYFSKVKIDPEQINVDQWQKLKEFKKKTYPNGLVEHYNDIVEFRTKLARQLDLKIKTLIAGLENEDGEEPEDYEFVSPSIDFKFLDTNSNDVLANGAIIKRKLIEFSNLDKVPDFVLEKDKKSKKESLSPGWLSFSKNNKNYYREYLDYVRKINLFFPIKFSVSNPSPISIRDIFIEIKIPKKDGIKISNEKIQEPEKQTNNLIIHTFSEKSTLVSNEKVTFSENESDYFITFSPDALQPKREIISKSQFFIGCEKASSIEMLVRIYADCFSEPVDQKHTLNIAIEETKADAMEITELL